MSGRPPTCFSRCCPAGRPDGDNKPRTPSRVDGHGVPVSRVRGTRNIHCAHDRLPFCCVLIFNRLAVALRGRCPRPDRVHGLTRLTHTRRGDLPTDTRVRVPRNRVRTRATTSGAQLDRVDNATRTERCQRWVQLYFCVVRGGRNSG